MASDTVENLLSLVDKAKEKILDEFDVEYVMKELKKSIVDSFTLQELPFPEGFSVLGNSDILYMYNATSHLCEEGDGMNSGFFSIKRSEYEKLKEKVEKYEHFLTNVKEEFTSGGHGCILNFNLCKIFNNFQIVVQIPQGIREVDDALGMIRREIKLIDFNQEIGCEYRSYHSYEEGVCGKPIGKEKIDRCDKHSYYYYR